MYSEYQKLIRRSCLHRTSSSAQRPCVDPIMDMVALYLVALSGRAEVGTEAWSPSYHEDVSNCLYDLLE